jgi:hypothetical protein
VGEKKRREREKRVGKSTRERQKLYFLFGNNNRASLRFERTFKGLQVSSDALLAPVFSGNIEDSLATTETHCLRLLALLGST